MADHLSLSLYARNINAFSINSFRRSHIPFLHPFLPSSFLPPTQTMQPDHANLRDDKPERMLSRVYLLGIISRSIFYERRFAFSFFLSLFLLLFFSLRIDVSKLNARMNVA